MQIPIISGIYTDESPDFRTGYPRNLIPVASHQGISNGYLRPADGIIEAGVSSGISRGGINWNGIHYRVMGEKLVTVGDNGVTTEIGNITGTDNVTFDYSFDYLSISANNKFYLYDGIALQQVTDPDLGNSIDHIWVDGYFMSTDGEFLIVTELNNPFAVVPTKYGSAEADPDPIKAIVKLRNEPCALNRYTIEVFDNIGGDGFPFQRIDGAQVQRGVIGTHACCVFLENIAFVGGGRNEPISVWLASSGSSVKISTREIDKILDEYSETALSSVTVESRVDKGHQFLYINLPNKTIVYDHEASKEVGQQVWFTLSSGLDSSKYRARHLVRCYNKWWVGDTNTAKIGYLTDTTSEHWGELVGWEFSTLIIYNDGFGAIFHEIELVCLNGRAQLGDDPRIMTQYSLDGESWSTPRYIATGKIGNRNKRISWISQGPMRHWRIQRFKGTSDAQLSIARLEARVEPLSV